MSTEKGDCAGCGISLLLRISMIVLFGTAGLDKFAGGLDNVVGYFQATFKDTWLPMPLVTFHARITPFVEVLIALWLLVGYRLKLAWMVTGLFTITLAFGMLVGKQVPFVANNFFYVFLFCVGLYFCGQDKCSVDALSRK